MKKLQLSPLLIIFISFLFFNPLLGQKIDESYQPIIKGVPLMYGFGLQDDGKVLLSGNMHFSGSKEIGKLIRVNPDATIDSAFNPPEFERQIINVSINKRGHTIVYGSEGYIKSINKDGSINENFQIDLEGREFRNIILAEDSTFLINSFSNSGYVVERIDETGKTMDSFDKLLLGRFISAKTAIQLEDGKIAINGSFETIRGEERKSIIIINNDGSIDDSFKTGTGLEPRNSKIKLTKSQGKILAYGDINNYNGKEFPRGAVRLNLDGSIDETFSSYRISIITNSYPECAIEDKNGKLIVAGRNLINDGYIDINRFNEDGTLDKTFKMVRINSYRSYLNLDLFIDDNNDLHIVGWFSETNNRPIQGYAKIDSNGNILEDFDLKLRRFGKVYGAISLKEGGTLIRGVITDIDTIPVSQPAIKLKKDGSYDSSFKPIFHKRDKVTSFTQLGNGDIILGGYFYNQETGQTYLLRKYDSNYDLIKDFVVEGHGYGLNDFDILENGDIIIAGDFWKVNGFEINKIAKLKPNGTLDQTFNQNDPFDKSWSKLEIESVGNNKIVVGGRWFGENRKYHGSLTMLDLNGNKVDNFTEIKNPEIYVQALNAGLKNNFIFSGQNWGGAIGSIRTYLYHYDGTSNLMDSVSINGTANKSSNLARFNDMLFLDENTFLLGGLFDEVNRFENQGLTKIGLNGKIDRFFDFNIEGEVFSIVREDDEHVIAFGEFNTVNGKRFNSGVRIKLINAPPGAPSQTEFEVLEDSIMSFSAGDLGVIDDDDSTDEISIIYQPGKNYTIKNNTIFPLAEFSGTLEVPIQITDEKDTIDSKLSIKILPINDPPEIINVKTPFSVTDSYKSLKISKSNFNYKDPDNTDEEIELVILEGENYTVIDNSRIEWEKPFNFLDVKVYLTDGTNKGKTFEFQIQNVSKPITYHNISGKLLDNKGEAVTLANIDIYQSFNTDSIELIKTIVLSDTNFFVFQGEKNSKYILKATPLGDETSNLIPTYYGDQPNLENAEIIQLFGDSYITIRLQVKPKDNYKISGVLVDPNGQKITEATVEIYQVQEANSQLLNTITISGNNAFSFSVEKSRKYSLKAIPDIEIYPDLVPTYFGNSIVKEEAELIELLEDVSISITVQKDKIIPTPKIQGFLNNTKGDSVDHAIIEIYSLDENGTYSLDEQISVNGKNNFEFTGEKNKNYIVKVIPNSESYTELLPTYFEKVLIQSEAKVISLKEDLPVSITLLEKPIEQKGNAIINGIALDTKDNEGGRISQNFSGDGTPIPNLSVYVFDKNDHLIGLDTTDTNGLFQFKNIITGVYKLVADYKNKPVDLTNSSFEISQNGQLLDLYLNIGDSLSVEVQSITGNNRFEKLEGVNIYPNPANDKLNIHISNDLSGDYHIIIHSILGKVIFDNSINKTNQNLMLDLDINDLPKGMYLLNISQGSSLTIKKFMKH